MSKYPSLSPAHVIQKMLSYRHLFHAGNFADVFKHALLTRLLIALNQKEKPYFYLDTHAGVGRYDLHHAWAQKAREYENGIARLWKRKDVPELLKPYLEAVRRENADGKLRYYPGSPCIAREFMRRGDRMVLTELNKTDYAALDSQFAREKRVAVQYLDGYQALKAYLPPVERRGLVLIDSSFDRAQEFGRLATALKLAHARWETGIYAIWYPLMGANAIREFERSMGKTGIRRILQLELTVLPADGPVIPGCGMLVINPPWKFEREAKSLLEWLAHALAEDSSGTTNVRWLTAE